MTIVPVLRLNAAPEICIAQSDKPALPPSVERKPGDMADDDIHILPRRSTPTATAKPPGASPRRSGPSRTATPARNPTLTSCARAVWNRRASSKRPAAPTTTATGMPATTSR